MSNKDLEVRLQMLEDREAIKELRASYCWTIDEGRLDEFLDLFTDEVEADFGDLGVFKGKAEWRKFVYERIPTFFSKMRHLIHNELTTKLEDNQAEGKAYFEFVGIREGNSFIGGGHYEHKYLKINGQWKIHNIKAVIYYMVPIQEGWASGNDYSGLKI
jgi:hypothetical protein